MKKYYDFLEIPLSIALIAIFGSNLVALNFAPTWLTIAISATAVLYLARYFRNISQEIDTLETRASEVISKKASSTAENILYDTSAFASHAFDAINSPIFIIDPYKRINIANLAAKKRFGIENTGARLEASVRTPEILDAVEKARSEEEHISISFERHFPSTTYENVEVTPFLHRNRTFYIISINDETNLRRAEKMRVDFLANAGHELRTPLTSIRGFLETLQGAARDDEQARDKFIDIMAKQAERMSRLINDILSLSKIELNEHLPPNDKINLNETLEFAINATVPIALSYNSNIIFTPPKTPLPIFGFTDEIQQVIINLLENGLKYGKHGTNINVESGHGVTLEQATKIGTKSIEASASMPLTLPENIMGETYSYVRIENFGKGIDKKYMSRLSERFYRIDDETSLIKGTGLGLAIVKHIIYRHKGGLIVESAPNDRTAFTFFIPN